MDMNNNNKIYMVTLSDYSEYDSSKCRNGGAYGYDYVYTYNRDTESFTYKWMTTCELIPDEISPEPYSLIEVLAEMANFIRSHADISKCSVYVNGIVVWNSTLLENMDVDMFNYFLDE